MTRDEARRLFRDVRKAKLTSVSSALNKPVLILFMLGRCANGEPRMVKYRDVKDRLLELFLKYRKERCKTADMWNPFWFLANDHIWELAGIGNLQPGRKYNSTHSLEDARAWRQCRKTASGGFLQELHEMLRADPRLLAEVARETLVRNFPPSMHADILADIRIEIDAPDAKDVKERSRIVRDPEFRLRILNNYGSQCALCGTGLLVAGKGGHRQVVGLEAAHIQWHAYEGPDTDSNGIALCSVDHKLFDYGVFTVGDEGSPLVIRVSEQVDGPGSERLIGYNGKEIRAPKREAYFPGEQYAKWHRENVFRDPAYETKPSPDSGRS